MEELLGNRKAKYRGAITRSDRGKDIELSFDLSLFNVLSRLLTAFIASTTRLIMK
jgi:hypothetical protein